MRSSGNRIAYFRWYTICQVGQNSSSGTRATQSQIDRECSSIWVPDRHIWTDVGRYQPGSIAFWCAERIETSSVCYQIEASLLQNAYSDFGQP